jgi:iron complex outermembrane receptor protein
VGLQSKKQNVTITAGQVAEADFVLSENATQLEEVIVSGRVDLNKEESYVGKTPLRKLENPQSYNSVSSEILKQQAVTNYDDAFRNVPGIARTWESTGRDGDGASYFALRGLEGQPALVNGLPGITNGTLDPANVEQIQVMKGPSATLFGANATSYASYGGLINTVTKKPYFTKGGEITYNVGSFGLNRITADVNAPLSSTDKVALRVNTAYHSEGSFQDAGFKKSFFIAPSLAYEVTDRLKFLVVTEILEQERAVAPVFFNTNRAAPLTYSNVKELNLNPDLSFTNNSLSIKNPRTNIQAQMIYKLSDSWSSQTVISRATTESDGYYSYIWPDAEGTNFGQYFTYVKESRVATDFQQNFNGDFKIAGLRNRILIGMDYFHQQATNNGLGYVWVRNVTPQGGENFIDPDTGEERDPISMSKPSIDALLAATTPGNSNASNSALGVYISDVINVTDQLLVLASLRGDYYNTEAVKSDPTDDFDEFVLSPKFGIVYQALPEKLSVFANYQNAFHNNGLVSVADADGSNPRLKAFKPDEGNQWEAGIKTNLLKDRLFATASYYDIKVKNRLVGDPANFYNTLQLGAIESKGFEIEFTANLVTGLSLIGGYSHNETLNTKGIESDFYSEPGRVPGGQGPQDQINFWGTYQFTKGALKNLGAGLGGNYASAYRVADNSITGIFDLPSYTVINASVFYNVDKFRIAINVNNVANEKYYIGYWSVNPQKPRNAVVSLAYKF